MKPCIELRFAIAPGTSTQPPKLQSRILSDDGTWQPWADVPIAVVALSPLEAALMAEARRREAFDTLPDDYEVN